MFDARAAGEDGGGTAARGHGMRLGAFGLGVVLALGGLELALRLDPQAISPRLLILFEPTLRSHIAAGSYPLQQDFRPVPRDDGGPDLFVPKPTTRIVSIDEPPDHAARFTDEAGFCNPPGRYRGHDRIDVIALGDSFAWCHAVTAAEAWPFVLGERTGLVTFSLGQGGTGPYEYLQLLREFGLVKRPRVVVMNVYGGNDLRDAAVYRDWKTGAARGERSRSDATRVLAPGLVASALGRHSYALNLLVAFASRIANLDAADWERTGVNLRYRVRFPTGPVDFNVQNRDRDEVVSARHLDDGSMPLALWDEALERFGALARENGFRAVVSYTPPAYAAYAERVELADPSLGPLLARFDDQERRYLADHAAADGYVFHDVTPDLRRASQEGSADDLLYDPVNLHLAPRGHEVVAASVARLLDALLDDRKI